MFLPTHLFWWWSNKANVRHQNWFGKLYAEKLTDIFLYSSARDPLLNMNRDANHYELFVVYTNFHCFFVTTSGEVETTNSKKAHAVFGRGRVFASNVAEFGRMTQIQKRCGSFGRALDHKQNENCMWLSKLAIGTKILRTKRSAKSENFLYWCLTYLHIVVERGVCQIR